jgi:hypothetical protein
MGKRTLYPAVKWLGHEADHLQLRPRSRKCVPIQPLHHIFMDYVQLHKTDIYISSHTYQEQLFKV